MVVDDVPRVHKKGECLKCAAGSGKKAGHRSVHKTFAVPRGWTIDDSGSQKVYVSPDNDTRLYGLRAVERYVNAGPCPDCVDGSGKREGHADKHVTFLLPSDWKSVVTIGNGATNTGAKSKYFISPDNKRFPSLAAVERYLTGTNEIKEWNAIRTFVLPSDWKTVVTIGQGASNTGKKNKSYISPDCHAVRRGSGTIYINRS